MIIAVVISKPLEMKIFEKEINQVLLEEKNSMTLNNKEQLALQLLAKVREVARRIRGLRQIILLYRGGLSIPVHSNQGSKLDLSELGKLESGD